MTLIDKVIGRLKQAAGDIADDEQLHRSGVSDERTAAAQDELRQRERAVERNAAEVADLESRRH